MKSLLFYCILWNVFGLFHGFRLLKSFSSLKSFNYIPNQRLKLHGWSSLSSDSTKDLLHHQNIYTLLYQHENIDKYLLSLIEKEIIPNVDYKKLPFYPKLVNFKTNELSRWQLESSDEESQKRTTDSSLVQTVGDYYYSFFEHIFQLSSADLFAPLKKANLVTKLPFLEELCSKVPDFFDFDFQDVFPKLLVLSSLVQNPNVVTITPSNVEAEKKSPSKKTKVYLEYLKEFKGNILHDKTSEISEFLDLPKDQDKRRVVNIILGSAGIELIVDLLLAHSLLTFEKADQVVLHCGITPQFLGSPTKYDALGHINFLATPFMSDVWGVHHFGDQLLAHVDSERILIKEHNDWNKIKSFDSLSEENMKLFQDSYFTIIKGEFNNARCSKTLQHKIGPYCTIRNFFDKHAIPSKVMNKIKGDEFEYGSIDFVNDK